MQCLAIPLDQLLLLPGQLAKIEIVLNCNSGCCCSKSSVDPFGGTNKIRGREHCLHGLSHVYACMGLNFSVQI